MGVGITIGACRSRGCPASSSSRAAPPQLPSAAWPPPRAPPLRRRPTCAPGGGVRSLFPLQRGVHHLAAFVFVSHPAPRRDAIERHRRGLDRDADAYLDAHQGALEQAVDDAARAYLGAEPDSIAFTDSTTMGLGLLYGGLKLEPGDEVVTDGARLLRDPRSLASAFRARPDPGPPHPAVPGRSQHLGRRARLERRRRGWSEDPRGGHHLGPLRVRGADPGPPIADVVDRKNGRTLLCVDGVHGFGVEDQTVGSLGCDVLVAGSHKWLFGPRGTGLVWARPGSGRPPGRPSRASTAAPTAPGSRAAPRRRARERPGTPGGFHSFEHRWALAEAFALHGRIGKRRVQQRIHELASRLKQGLASIRSVRLVTPRSPGLSAGVVVFDVGTQDPQRVVDELLRRRIVASVTPYAERHVRLGAGIPNGTQRRRGPAGHPRARLVAHQVLPPSLEARR